MGEEKEKKPVSKEEQPAGEEVIEPAPPKTEEAVEKEDLERQENPEGQEKEEQKK